jgi:hypothetical protein
VLDMSNSDAGELIVRAVTTTAPSGTCGAAVVRVKTWNEGERFIRAVKRLGTFWGMAIVAAIIPPHWPWFSICLLLGPITAWLVWKQPGTVQACEVPCPVCARAVAFEEQAEAWPAAARCPECRDIFSIEPTGDRESGARIKEEA